MEKLKKSDAIKTASKNNTADVQYSTLDKNEMDYDLPF